jgi:hypothetical protein
MANITAKEHYTVNRQLRNCWKDSPDEGEIRSLSCDICDFVVFKRLTPKPRTSKSGLGRYNRMRAKMVSHWHEDHRNILYPGEE